MFIAGRGSAARVVHESHEWEADPECLDDYSSAIGAPPVDNEHLEVQAIRKVRKQSDEALLDEVPFVEAGDDDTH